MALLEQVTLQEGEPVEQEVILSGAGRPLLPADLAQEIASLHLERSLLRKELRLYQEVGAAFALVVGRAILGDEMGLGKSVQALAAIAHVIVRERQHHHLVICPASVVDTWLQEIAETLHDVPAFTYRGKDADVDRRRWAASRGIMVVSYEMTRSLVNHPLPHLGFAIVDEAHLVKNPSSRRSQTTAELVTPAKRCLLMGGTPMENNAEEFLHLIELVDPDKGRALRGLFNRAERAYREPDRFRHAIADIYLRRNKHEVIRELPPLTWRDERILLNSAQQRTYEQTILTRPLITARRLLTTIGGTDGGKMQRLRDIAEECRANGQKLLVFSFFLDALDMAGTVLNGDVAHIRGGMSAAEKTRNTEGFENAHGFSALLIQIIAGGHGLNLHSASVVVVIEPQYKPTTEWQAIGRAHRIGQTRPVTVYRLIAHDTVETRLIERTGFKAEIFNRLARPSDLAEDIEARISDRLDNPDDLLDEERQRIRDRPPPD
jgi:SNF2 family DNA or RNA helicase